MTAADHAGPAVAGLRRRIDWLPYAIGALTIFVLVAFLLYPIFKTVLFSFVKNGEELAFANLTLINFERFLEGATFTKSLWHSMVVGVLTTIISTMLALPAAYA